MAQLLGVVRRLYDRWIPELWAQRVALIRGRSLVFQPCFRETGSIFIHVPRTAGTSISTALYGGNIGHRFAMDYQRISAREFRRTSGSLLYAIPSIGLSLPTSSPGRVGHLTSSPYPTRPVKVPSSRRSTYSCADGSRMSIC